MPDNTNQEAVDPTKQPGDPELYGVLPMEPARVLIGNVPLLLHEPVQLRVREIVRLYRAALKDDPDINWQGFLVEYTGEAAAILLDTPDNREAAKQDKSADFRQWVQEHQTISQGVAFVAAAIALLDLDAMLEQLMASMEKLTLAKATAASESAPQT